MEKQKMCGALNGNERILPIATTLCLFAVVAFAASALNSPLPAERRQAVLEVIRTRPGNAVPLLATALNDQNSVVRRTAARALTEFGKDATPIFALAMGNPDPEVRMIAFQALNKQGEVKSEHLSLAIKDRTNTAMRLFAVQILAKSNLSPENRAMLETAASDELATIREIAAKALTPFAFYRKAASVRDHADQVVSVVQSIPLPAEGWRLKFDPRQDGHLEKWFNPALSEADWAEVGIGKYWDDFGFTGQTGIGWYRGRFTLPEKPVLNGVELSFGAVDEAAWVWVNGEYAGQHDVGAAGWDAPFQIDVTPFLLWGKENQITIRVLNTAKAGGISKPVTLEVLKLGN